MGFLRFCQPPTQGHLYALSARHMAINNSPSAAGCLCFPAPLTELSVTGTGCSSRRSGWALFDSHVKLSQIHVNRCRARGMGNHSNDASPGAQIKSHLRILFPFSVYFESIGISHSFGLSVSPTQQISVWEMVYNTVYLWKQYTFQR